MPSVAVVDRRFVARWIGHGMSIYAGLTSPMFLPQAP